MASDGAEPGAPRTEALRRALQEMHDAAAAADLLFLEDWQAQRHPDIASTLRAS